MVNHETASRILDLGKQQKSIREIATLVGLSKSTVSNVFKNATPREVAVESASTQQAVATAAVAVGPTLVISDDKAGAFLKEINAFNPAETSNTVSTPSIPELKAAAKKEAFVENFLAGIVPSSTERLVPQRAPKHIKEPTRPRSKKAIPNTMTVFVGEEDATGERATLLSTITMNVNSFEPLLKDLLKPNKDEFLNGLRKKSTPELAVTLKMLEHTRSVGNISNQLRHFFYMGASGVELVATNFFKLKAQGYAMALRTQDEEIRMIMKEICMERVESLKKIQRPELRLAAVMATTLLAVDSQNRFAATAAPAAAAAAKAVVSPDVEAKFGDL